MGQLKGHSSTFIEYECSDPKMTWDHAKALSFQATKHFERGKNWVFVLPNDKRAVQLFNNEMLRIMGYAAGSFVDHREDSE